MTVETVASGLEHPWGIAFLPGGGTLVTERPGRMRIVSAEGEVSRPIAGVRRVATGGQGGLFDVALDPGFATNRGSCISYAEPREGGNGTAVARAPPVAGRQPAGESARHLPADADLQVQRRISASRLAFAPDGDLFVTLGERFSAWRRRRISRPISARSCASGPMARSEGQSVRGQGQCAAGDLVLRPPQSAGARLPPADRPAVGDRARPARRRRDQHPPGRAATMAGPSSATASIIPARRSARARRSTGHGAAGLLLGSLHRALGHGLRDVGPLSRLEGQPASSARWPGR